MYTPPSIAGAVATIRAFLAANDWPGIVITRDAAEVEPVAAVRLCRHCGLVIGSAGEHGACEESAERSVRRAA